MVIFKPQDEMRVLVRVLINLACKVPKIILGIEEKMTTYVVKLLRLLLDTQDTYFSYRKY